MTKVMVVDDEPDLRKMLGIMMKNEGYDTEMAVDGSDFLEKVDSFNPDIVTLDVMMPGLRTEEILEKLKKRKSKPKVILLTVVRFDGDEKRLFEQRNVVDYIKKPFDIDVLMDTVKKHEN
jgi:two-component system OmpR family response regulator